MTNPKSSVYLASQDHLTTDQLFQYLEGGLSSTDSNQVEQHLLDCDLCSEAFEGLSLVPRQKAEHTLFEINHYIKNRSNHRKGNPILSHLKNWGLTTAILFILIFSAVAVWYLAKQVPTEPALPTQLLNQSATPIPGEEAYRNYLQSALRYPAEAREKQITGTVKLQFKVNPDSTLADIKVLQTLGYDCDQEAMRLLREGPKWKPAAQNGQIIAQVQIIDIYFRLP